MSARVLLASMPWPRIDLPSIQLGTLTALLQQHGREVETRSFFLDFLDFAERVARESGSEFDSDSYSRISEHSWRHGFGDWLFAVEPYRGPRAESDAAYLEYLDGMEAPAVIAAGLALRGRLGEFLEWCADDILAAEPDVVGFTATFNQNVPTINLALRLKARRPDLRIVMGGANCDGPMGIALHQGFPCLDYVVRGEAEHAFPALLRALDAGAGFDTVPGLCHRDAQGATVVNEVGPDDIVLMKDVPVPDFDEYFARLHGAECRAEIEAKVALPVESSRGCWWGQKHHCTFCGLNGTTMAYRSKDSAAFVAEIAELTTKYRRTLFQPVDNILDLRYFRTVLPWIAEARRTGTDYAFFYETKANLKKEHLEIFRDANVRIIQPGIESLSTPILKLMDKGVTALQNIRLLKWATEYRLTVAWSIIHGFPGEDPAEYVKMAELVPSLVHLKSPSFTRLFVERFSPYHMRPEAYGLDIEGPARWYRSVYDLDDATLAELAYDFEWHVGDRDESYANVLRDAVAIWTARDRPRALAMKRGPGFVRIVDTRASAEPDTITLSGTSAALYLRCDAGASVDDLCASTRDAASGELLRASGVREFLDELVTRRLAFREGPLYLSLATADNPRVDDRAASLPPTSWTACNEDAAARDPRPLARV